MPSGFNKSRRGFSLTEVVVAGALLIAIMTPILFTFGAGSRSISMTQDEFLGHAIAVELLEQLQAVPFELLPEGRWTDAQIKDGQPLGDDLPVLFRVTAQPKVEREVIITTLKKNNTPRFRKLEIRVKMPGDSRTPARTIVLKGLVADERG
jgi:hypothetical protein